METGQAGQRWRASKSGRLDVEIARRTGASRASVRRLLLAGGVCVNGQVVKKGAVVHAGDEVYLLKAPAPSRFCPLPGLGALQIRWSTERALVVEKARGMPSHPLRPEERDTLANLLVAHSPSLAEASEDPREAGLVHRLDTNTSGLLLVARDRSTWTMLREALRSHRIEKEYLALCRTPPPIGMIDAPIDTADRRKVKITETGRPARTEVLEVSAVGVLFEVRINASHATRHQVRVHLAHAGSPLVGDSLYGGESFPGWEGHALHASRISFRFEGAHVDVKSPLPAVYAPLTQAAE